MESGIKGFWKWLIQELRVCTDTNAENAAAQISAQYNLVLINISLENV